MSASPQFEPKVWCTACGLIFVRYCVIPVTTRIFHKLFDALWHLYALLSTLDFIQCHNNMHNINAHIIHMHTLLQIPLREYTPSVCVEALDPVRENEILPLLKTQTLPQPALADLSLVILRSNHFLTSPLILLYRKWQTVHVCSWLYYIRLII